MTRIATRFGGLFFALLTACGGGGSSDAPRAALQLAPEVLLTGHAIVPFADTGKRDGTRLSLRFTAVFEDYFRCVPDGHAGVMVNAAVERIPAGPYEFELHAEPGRLGYSINGRGAGEVDSPVPMRPEIVFFDTGGGVCPYVIRISNPTATWSEP